MKCKIRPEIKEFFYILIVAVLLVLMLSVAACVLSLLVGYVAVQWFDIYMILYAQSPYTYYIKEGLIFVIILGVGGFLILSIGLLLPTIIELVRFKYTWKNIKGLIIVCE